MTTEQDPPRLRTLGGELPRDLALALAESDDDAPTSAEFAALGKRLHSELRERAGEARHSRFVPRRPRGRARVVSLVLTFALGAGAGVLVSGGIFVASHERPAEPAHADTPATEARPARAPHAPHPGAPPAPSALTPTPEDTPAPPPHPTRDPVRPPTQNPGADLPSAAPSAPYDADREEFALLARAQSALATNPGLALALASDHERKFPRGVLVQEREVVAIDALLRLGRRAEAASRAARFHREFPASVHGRRLDVLLGNGGGPTGDHN